MNYDGSDLPKLRNGWSAFFTFLLIAAAVIMLKGCI